jgi:hypothetical protein
MGGGPEYPTHLMDDGHEYAAEEYWAHQAAMGMGTGMGTDGVGQPPWRRPRGFPSAVVGRPAQRRFPSAALHLR